MKNLILLFLVFCSTEFVFFAQTNNKQGDVSFQNIHEENIYIHINNDFYITGDNILYAISCLNSKNGKPSNLSKVAYVELIGSDLKSHIFQKVNLKNGRGSGDFLLPSSLTSGSYKLIAYTKWMLNTNKKVFDKNIMVVNPFSNNSNIISLEDEETVIYKKEEQDAPKMNKLFKLFKNKKSFSKREKIVFNATSLSQDIPLGNYSISVRKIDSLSPLVTNKTSETFLFKNRKVDTISFKNGIPEFRGETIYGKVVNKNTGKGISGISVSLSIPGKNYLFKIATTDNYGSFFMNINSSYDEEEAILRVLDPIKDFSLEISQFSSPNMSYLEFDKFVIDKKIRKIIESKSIFNQIENAYYFFKQDSVIKTAEIKSFYGNDYSKYILTDYTKFKKLKETFIEIVDYVSFVGKKGEQKLRIRDLQPLYIDREPLVLLNGVPVVNHSKIANLDSKNIYQINILKKNYIYSNKIYKGIIDIKGNDNSILDYIKDDYFITINLLKPERKKKYFFPDYSKNSLERIPDLRNQLYWNPEFILDKNVKEFSFFTSDNVGDYEVLIEGFSYDGRPILIKDYFSVTN
jgi:hypothetical protein